MTTLHGRLAAILATTGTTQTALMKKMERLGFVVSPATLSRMLTGKRVISEKELEMICKALGREDYLPELLALREGGAPLPPEPAPPLPGAASVAETRQNARSPRRNPVVAGLAGLLAIGLIAAAVILIFRGPAPSEPSLAQAKERGTPAVLPDCTRREVSAQDLWLRDEYGSPLTEVTRGTKLTVKNVRNPQGHDKYWEVVTEDGKRGWADRRHMKPLCQ